MHILGNTDRCPQTKLQRQTNVGTGRKGFKIVNANEGGGGRGEVRKRE